MKAVILAAGVGSRMGEVGRYLPKCLLQIGGKPILRKQVETLNANGITDISVVVGYCEEMIKRASMNQAVKFYTNHRFAETGMLESLLCASDELNDSFVLVYGDVYFEREVIGKLLLNTDDICLVVNKCGNIEQSEGQFFERYYGQKLRKVSTKVYLANGWVKKLSKSPESSESGVEYIGIAKFSETKAQMIHNKIRCLVASGQIAKFPSPSYLFSSLIESGEKIGAVFVDQRQYVEVDYPENLDEARRRFDTSSNKGHAI
ncbi:MAG: phosphocholine cytidylyltransferase family protein [Deltaproteobacteria bacterium]|nr:phosphocholine cytidylyltransferase family protein [Deltaproteobacteria bacterium]